MNNLTSDYIDNNLPPLIRLKVKIHLFMCHQCRNFVIQLGTTVNVLKGLKTPPPSRKVIDHQVSRLMGISKNLNSEEFDDKKQ